MKLRALSVGVTLLILAVAAAVALPTRAQTTTGNVEGTVTDATGVPLPGVSVEVRGPRLQGTRNTVTDAAGRYRFPALPPGTYTVVATLSGFKTVEKNDVKVALDATATVPMRMEISVTQEVVVTGEAPVVDITSNTGGSNIRADVVDRLPVQRNYSSIVQINPGVSQDTAETQGRAQSFTIYGSSSVENQYLVDGVNTTNVIKGFQGKALTPEFIEEVQVKTSGYEAEYGRATGGIINVITKSGGNEFHGDGFGYFNRKNWTAANKAEPGSDEWFVDRTRENREDFGADLGGYFLKDRIWFFGAYNRINRNSNQISLAGVPDVATSGQNFPIVFHSNIYSGKLTIRPTESTTIVGTVFGDPETRTGAIANFTSTNPIVQQGVRNVGGTDYSISGTQLFGTVALANVRYGHHKDRFELQGAANEAQIVDYTVSATNPARSQGFGSIFGPTNNNNSTRDQVRADGTVFVTTHEIRGGIDLEYNKTNTTSYYTGGQVIGIRPCGGTLSCPSGQTVFYQHSFYTNSATDPVGGFLPGGNVANPKTDRLGFFLQDSWKVLPSLTLNLGVRYDQEDVQDYSGVTVFKLKNEWQPRIGFAWDILGDGSSKVSGSYGRFYYALPTDLNVRAYGAQTTASTFNFDPIGIAQDPSAPRNQQVQGGPFTEPVQSDLKGIYQDEVTLGFDKAIDPTFAVGVRGTYRTLGRTIEDRCDLDPGFPESNENTCVIVNPGSDDPFATGQFHGCQGQDFLDTSGNPPESGCSSPATFPSAALPKAKRTYWGIEAVARKQVSTVLWAQASYIYSQLRGNYDGAARVSNVQSAGVAAQTDPGINADFDYALFLNNAYGKLFLDRPHSARLDVAWTAPFGVQVGFQGFVRSGAPRSVLGYFNSQYGTELFLQPRGSNGREPTEFDINASLGYAIKLQPVTITLFAQGFNLTNRQTVVATDPALTINPPGDPQEFNPDYSKSILRRDPRTFRLGARVSF